MGKLVGLAATVAGLALAACDDPICTSEVFLAVQTSHIIEDVAPDQDGVQADVEVQTSIEGGAPVTLEVLDGDRVIETVTRPAEADGHVRFTGVTVSSPTTTLRASVETTCGSAEDERTLEVLPGSGCELSISPLPVDGALNATTDLEPATPGHRTELTVVTRPGWIVELRSTVEGFPAGSYEATSADGRVTFVDHASDGAVQYQATCVGSDIALRSRRIDVLVDTTPPTCVLVVPDPDSTLTGGADTDGDPSNGIALTAELRVDGDHVVGQPVVFTVFQSPAPEVEVPGTPIDAQGRSTLPLVLTDGLRQINATAYDAAGNTCTVEESVVVDAAACDLTFAGPAVYTVDANGTAADGSQADVVLQVSEACAGRGVSLECNGLSVFTLASAAGLATARMTVCGSAPCETEIACRAYTSTADGHDTITAARVRFDSQGPTTTVELAVPAAACGATLTPAADVDAMTPGVQVVASVLSPGATARQLDVTAGNATQRFAAASPVTIVLAPGTNRLVGIGLDEHGNRGVSAPCVLTLADP